MTFRKPRQFVLALCLGLAAPGIASAHEPESPDPRGETTVPVALASLTSFAISLIFALTIV